MQKHIIFSILIIIIIITSINLFAKIPSYQELQQTQSIKNSFQKKSLEKTTYTRPDFLPKTYISANGNFKIHYTTEGNHAVNTESTNPDEVPDWVFETAKIAERAYYILVDSLHLDSPPNDGVDGDEFDIYIINYGGSYYAETINENTIPETQRPYDYTSYLKIDNDYIESSYYTNNYDALKVTIVHEFFHMIQLGYNYDTNSYLSRMSAGDTFFFEWSSVWFEDFCYPEVNDYINYAKSFSFYPDDSIWSSSYWYSHGIFIKFIIDKYSVDILKKTWDKIKNEERAFFALQETIREETNTTLDKLYNEFCQRMYYSGSKYNQELSVSNDSQYFPVLRINYGDRYEFDGFKKIDSDISAFSTLPIELTFNTSQHFGLIEDHNFSDKFIGSYIFDDNDKYTNNNFQLDSDSYISKCSMGDTLILFITNKNHDETQTLNLTIDYVEPDNFLLINKIFPNPVDANGSINISISTKETTNLFNLKIYNLLGQKILDKKYDKNINGKYSINFHNDINQPLSSGIYLLKIEANGKEKFEKFTIIK